MIFHDYVNKKLSKLSVENLNFNKKRKKKVDLGGLDMVYIGGHEMKISSWVSFSRYCYQHSHKKRI